MNEAELDECLSALSNILCAEEHLEKSAVDHPERLNLALKLRSIRNELVSAFNIENVELWCAFKHSLLAYHQLIETAVFCGESPAANEYLKGSGLAWFICKEILNLAQNEK